MTEILNAMAPILIVGIMFGIPLTAWAIRFTSKSVIEAWVKLRESEKIPQSQQVEFEALKLRVAALEAVWEQRLGAGTLHADVNVLPAERQLGKRV
jgi:hypothetical protein